MRKGIELSMNFFVVIVLSLVIFGFSVSFVYDIYEKAQGLQAKTFDDLDKQLGYLRCGSEQVCIGEKNKELRRGSFGILGIRVLNVLDAATDFKVFVRAASLNSQTDPDYLNSQHRIILLPKESDVDDPPCGDHARCVMLDPDKSRDFALGIEVNKKTASGAYVFDVYVQYNDKDGKFVPYGEAPKYKVIVKVP